MQLSNSLDANIAPSFILTHCWYDIINKISTNIPVLAFWHQQIRVSVGSMLAQIKNKYGPKFFRCWLWVQISNIYFHYPWMEVHIFSSVISTYHCKVAGFLGRWGLESIVLKLIEKEPFFSNYIWFVWLYPIILFDHFSLVLPCYRYWWTCFVRTTLSIL